MKDPKIAIVGPKNSGKSTYLMGLFHRLYKKKTPFLRVTLSGVMPQLFSIEEPEKTKSKITNTGDSIYERYLKKTKFQTDDIVRYILEIDYKRIEDTYASLTAEIELIDIPGEFNEYSEKEKIYFEKLFLKVDAFFFIMPASILYSEDEKVIDSGIEWLEAINELRKKTMFPKQIFFYVIFTKIDESTQVFKDYPTFLMKEETDFIKKITSIQKLSDEVTAQFKKKNPKYLTTLIDRIEGLNRVKQIHYFFVSSIIREENADPINDVGGNLLPLDPIDVEIPFVKVDIELRGDD